MCSASSDSVPWAAEKTEHDESVPGAVALLPTVAKRCYEVYLVKRDGTDIVTIDDFVAKTKCKRFLNAVLNAKEVRPGTVAKGCADESVQERLGLYCEVTTAFIILTESELRSALDRQRDLPKYLTGGIPTLEVPLATVPAQRVTVFLFGHHRPHRELTIRTMAPDRQLCVLDPRDQVYSGGQGDVVLDTVRGSTLQGADVSTALDKNSCGNMVSLSEIVDRSLVPPSGKANRGFELGQDVDSDDMDEAAPIISGPAAMLFEGHSGKVPPSGGRQTQGGAARHRR